MKKFRIIDSSGRNPKKKGKDHMDNGAGSYRRYLDGDEKAFEEIVKELRDPLTYFINSFVNDFHAAEDIAIDCFAYLAAAERYDFRVQLKTYLYMLGRSRAIDYIRRRKRRQAVGFDEVEAYVGEQSVEEEYETDQRRLAVREAMASLPEKMRCAVYLVYFEDLSYEETARVMKVSKKQVDNLLYRAKGMLRSIIGEKGEL